MIYTGGGVILANASPELNKLVDTLGFPCTNTLMGLGAYRASSDKFVGMPGMHGTYEANMAMQHCDVLIAIGARFDDRVIGNPKHFASHPRKIIHIDIDPSSISKRVKVDIPIVGNVKDVLLELLAQLDAAERASRIRRRWPAGGSRSTSGASRDCLKYPTSRRSHQAAVRGRRSCGKSPTATPSSPPTSASTRCGRRSTTTSTSRAAGSIPAAWARWASACRTRWACRWPIPDATVACITGEGSIQMCIQELATCKQYHLTPKIILLNNRFLGMVRQWQQIDYGSRYSESYMDSLPDFDELAESYGHVGMKIENPGDVDGALNEAFGMKDRLVFMNFITDQTENVWPMVKAGKGLSEMLLGSEDL